jgi:hypothetical protein
VAAVPDSLRRLEDFTFHLDTLANQEAPHDADGALRS